MRRSFPDGFSEATLAGAWMAHAAFWTDGPGTSSPILVARDLLLTWDGRLDNRGELLATLGLANEQDARQTDLLILATAYRRWGPRFLAKVIGDFAIALWDVATERLLLARDPFGTRPLFFYRGPDSVTWASRLEALRLASAPSAAVDEEFIADFFCAFPGRSNTPFAGLEAVPPGEAVLFDRQDRRALVFWEPEQVEASASLSDADAEEGLRHHFSEAVRNRLRGGRPVCCELSGGLDSSSIVCVADDLLQRGITDVPDLATATFTFNRSPTSDESVFVNAVRHRVGRRHFALTESASPLFAGLDEAYLEYPAPKACFRALSDRMVAEMYVAGARVALSGFGGDEVLLSSGSSFAVELADLARELRFGALPSRFRLWQRRLGGSLAVLLWQNLVHPLLPKPLRVRAPLYSFSLEPLLETEFVRRKHLSRRMLESSNEVTRDLSPSQRLRVAGIRCAVRSVSWQYDYGSHPVENRFPFLDRPLVEFCLGLPLAQHVRDGDGRSLHRRALASFLPPEVLSRRDKRGPDEALMRGLSQEWSRLAWLLESPRVCQRGWVRPEGFRRALDELRFGVRTTGASLVPKVLALEVWLRHLEQRAP